MDTKEKKKFWAAGGAGVGLVLLAIFCCCGGGGIIWLVLPREQVIASSKSPAGDLRVDILHIKPRWPASQPHTYRIYYVDEKSNKPLEGDPAILNLGTEMLKGADFIWVSGNCVVNTTGGGSRLITGSVKDGRQSWVVIQAGG